VGLFVSVSHRIVLYFLLAIGLSVLRFTAFDYPFGINKHFFYLCFVLLWCAIFKINYITTTKDRQTKNNNITTTKDRQTKNNNITTTKDRQTKA
jgi:hypothetical protein